MNILTYLKNYIHMYFDQIVDYINSVVKTKLGQKASNSTFLSLCKIIQKDINDNEATIAFIDNSGNDVTVFDDTYSLIVYHRFVGFTFQPNELNAANSFGDGASTKSAHGNFIMGVYGKRNSLDLTEQELTASVSFSFPDDIPRNIITDLQGLKKVMISPISTNNSGDIKTIDARIADIHPEDIFFTVNYRVAITGDAACLSTCGPDCF